MHPLTTYSLKDKKLLPYSLSTSHEFFLKSVLSESKTNNFSLGYVFRDDPNSPIHRNQFIMLEWYRIQSQYQDLFIDLENILKESSEFFNNQDFTNDLWPKNHTLVKMSMRNFILDHFNFDFTLYPKQNDFAKIIHEKFPEIKFYPDLAWDDLFNLFFLNKVEPILKKIPAIILFEFPIQLRALAQTNNTHSLLADRFELYCFGIEIANGYQEITNTETINQILENNLKCKKEIYNYEFPQESFNLNQLAKLKSISYSGISLGTERLFSILSKTKNSFLSDLF